MTIYAIGDIQGCHHELLKLLDLIAFDPAHDQVWFTGDLVNRGPDSLKTLRTIRSLGASAQCVLGNHDLHLLAVAEGASRPKRQDTLSDILAAPDREELLAWLRNLPLIHHHEGFYLIHAGLPPQWNLEQALERAHEVEEVLRGPAYPDFFRHMYGDTPELWRDDLEAYDRLRFITNCFTRLRFLNAAGCLRLMEKGAPDRVPDLLPWFAHPQRKSRSGNIVFGHWSTLGFYQGHHVTCLDTGCLWGGMLTAMKLDGSAKLFSVPSARAEVKGN